MFQKFKTKELVACALFGALLFLVVFILGTALLMITGVPASGGIASMLFAMLVLTIGVKIVNKFGAGVIIITITGILAIPTLTFGPPGIYKVLMLFLIGLIFDLLIFMLKRNKSSYIIASMVAALLSAPMIYVFLVLFGLPGPEKLKPVLVIFSALYGVMGIIGAYLGVWLYDKKLKHKPFIRQLQE